MENQNSEDEKCQEFPEENLKKKVIKNNWQILSIAFGVIIIILLVLVFRGGITGGVIGIENAISAEEAGQKIMEFVNTQGANAELVKINDDGSFYEVILLMQGQEVPLYITKDGKSFTQALISLSGDTPTKNNANRQTPPQNQPPTGASKSDRPNVELFVMSHCPYGTQMEKGILPVVKELEKDIDFEIKFVNYAMHGKKELDEELRQYCIQKDYNDKYFQYLSKFLETEDPYESLQVIGISESNLEDCVQETDKKYKITELYEDPQKSEWSGRFPPFKVHDSENKKYGVRGSPTLVINGQQVQSGRDAQSILSAVCSAFTNKPKGCDTDMTSFGSPAPGFGFDGQGGSATTAGCGV